MSEFERALVAGRLRGRLTDEGWELQVDGDQVGRLRGDQVEVEDRIFRIDEHRGLSVVHDARGSVVGTLRRLPYGTVVVRVGPRALRVVRLRGFPTRWQATWDVGGEEVLSVMRLGRQLRFRVPKAPAEHDLDAVLTCVLMCLAVAPAPATSAAA